MITQEVGLGYGLYDLKKGKELKLAMQSLLLTGQIHSFGARLMVSHVLQSSETEPIEAVYSFMLPKDGALRRFYITGDGFSAHSELKPTQDAEKQYEDGIEQGHLSALAKNYRDGVVNLNIGNIRPNEIITVHLEIIGGVESHHNGFRFRFPFTLAPSYHAQAKMIECSEGQGEIELPEDKFGDVILPPFMKDSKNLHKIGFNLNVGFPQDSIEIASPSHNIQTKNVNDSLSKVSLSIQEDIPNRDLVLDVHSKKSEIQIHQGIDKTGETSFICTIPSSEFGKSSQESRNFVFLLDRSGSMRGYAMKQAKNALRACLSALSESDRFSLIAFDDNVEVFDSMVNGTMENRERLEKFLDGVDARGGTELMHGIQTAASILGDCQGDIMVITDGQVFGGEEIMQQAKALSIRLHILGIGAASQDRFISSLARETGGISKFVTPRERIDMAALELFSGIGLPVATDIEVELEGIQKGQIEPHIPTQVFESSSLQIFGHCEEESNPQIVMRWTNSGQKHERVYSIESGIKSNGNTLRLIRGSRLITDIENMDSDSSNQRSIGRRQNRRVNEKLKSLSAEYDLASREMSLVSVIEREGDQAGKLPKTTVIPVGMPQDVEFESYFSNSSMAHGISNLSMCCYRVCEKVESFECYSEMPIKSKISNKISSDSLVEKKSASTSKENTRSDLMVNLAAMIEPDGGMPGDSNEDRILSSIVILLFFVKEGSAQDTGPFQSHAKKLMDFLRKSIGQLSADYQAYIYHLLDNLESDRFASKDLVSHVSDIGNKNFTATADIWNYVLFFQS